MEMVSSVKASVPTASSGVVCVLSASGQQRGTGGVNGDSGG